MKYTVVGFFNDEAHVTTAANELQSKGFSNDKIDSSLFRTEGDYSGADYEYEEDEKTSGFWSSLFGDDDDEKDRKRNSRMGSRSHVVTVHADDEMEADKAASIMDDCGALDVTEDYDSFKTGQTLGYNEDLTTGLTDSNADSISVIKENLEVGKREVDSGSVRVRSRVVEKPVEEHVRLRKERVYVTRKPVDRQLSDTEAAGFKDETIEMTAHSEKAVVSKTAHVVEEISINKDVDTEDKTISDTVKETEVDIDDDGTRLDDDDDLNLRNDAKNKF